MSEEINKESLVGELSQAAADYNPRKITEDELAFWMKSVFGR